MIPASTGTHSHETPFDHAPLYRVKYWFGTLPLPKGQKEKPPTGFTGHAAPFPQPARVEQWREQQPEGNICLRLAGVDDDHEVIGVDVDQYFKGGKQKFGHDQLTAIEQTLGRQLPPTWTSSARTDGKSGIRYYRVPRGLHFPGQIDKDIECIQKGHRYAVVWPSTNPDTGGTMYWWFPPGAPLTEAGKSLWDGTVPDARKLPVLPDAWIDHLTNGRTHVSVANLDLAATVTEIDTWAEDTFNDGSAEAICSVVRDKIAKHKSRITDEATSHDKAKDFHWSLYQLAAEGHSGWAAGIRELNEHYAREVIDRDKRDPNELRGELFRSRTRALRKIKAEVESLQAFGVQSPPRLCTCKLSADPGPTVFATFLADIAKIVAQQPRKASLADRVLRSQLRMAHRLADDASGQHIYVVGLGWLFWDGKRWAHDSDDAKIRKTATAVLGNAVLSVLGNDSDAANALRSDVRKCESDSGLAGMIKIARRDGRLSRTVGQLDANPDLINAQNGVVDVQTGTLHPHDPAHLMTKVCRGSYLADLPTHSDERSFDTFIRRIIPKKDVREFLQRLTGMGLYGKLLEKKLPILCGSGDNGKNVFWEAINYALGDYAVVLRPDLLVQTGRSSETSEVRLRGVRWAVVSETPEGGFFSETTVKRLTGDRVIVARELYQSQVTFPATHTIALVTNYPPNFTGNDKAMRTRLLIVPFDVEIPREEQDHMLGLKLENEADVVFTWLVRGAVEYTRQGLSVPETVIQRTKEYHDKNDLIGRWLSDRYKTGDAFKIDQTKLHSDWLDWASESGCSEQAKDIGRNKLLLALRERGFHSSRSNGVNWLNGLAPKLSLVMNTASSVVS